MLCYNKQEPKQILFYLGEVMNISLLVLLCTLILKIWNHKVILLISKLGISHKT